MGVEGFVRDLYNVGIDRWEVNATWLFMYDIEEFDSVVENFIVEARIERERP